MLHACIVAFSMYSKIPMPKVIWNEKNMRYALCFFPLVGCVIGGITMGFYYFFQHNNMGIVMQTSIYLVIPLIITGGIHLDGYMDTMDGLCSYQDKAKKLEILKDPHTGAFAMIAVLIYYLIAFGVMSEVSEEGIWLVAIGYGYSRTLSGLGVVTLKSAKSDGLVTTFAQQAKKKTVRNVMIIYIGIFLAGMMCVSMIGGLIIGAIGISIFLYYRHMAYREFGGITGDLAGYFVQICELIILVGAVIATN